MSIINTYTDHLACAPWTSVAEVRRCCTRIDCSTTVVPDDAIEEAIEIATELLFAASGRQFSGICTEAVRPCLDCSCPCSWEDICGCCKGYRKLNIGLWPIQRVVEVDIAGTILPASAYHLESYRYLVLTPVGPDYERENWPTCQKMDRPKGAPETFTITVEYGVEPPPMGVRAARELACEYISCFNEGPCRLPVGTKNIIRQGVTIDVADAEELATLGMFGIPSVDRFLSVYNPAKLTSSTFVWSPDLSTNGHIRNWG